jgi:hypothetical protein
MITLRGLNRIKLIFHHVSNIEKASVASAVFLFPYPSHFYAIFN